MRRRTAFTFAAALGAAVLFAGGTGPGTRVHSQVARPGQVPPDAPVRDAPAQPLDQQPAGKGRISGRVVAADTGRPLPRVRVALGSPVNGASLTALTDEDGAFEFLELRPGRYNLTVFRGGYVTLQYGQRRPLLPGTPLQLADGQQLSGIEFRLPRGSVVSGHVFDEMGEPMPGAMVQVLRYQYNQGRRQLVPAGGGQTDDRGQYRVWGLMPGEYFVSATATPAFALAASMAARGNDVVALAGVAGRGRGGRGGRAAVPFGATADSDEQTTYAPTYYPGVHSPAEARSIAVGLSAEVLDVNFSVALVRTARLTGRVLAPDGATPRGGNVNLTLDAGFGRPMPGTAFGAPIQSDGSFTITNVPPGQYVLRARSNAAREQAPTGGRGGPGRGNAGNLLYATVPVAVADGDLDGLVVTLAPGATLGGTIALDGTPADPSIRYEQFRVTTVPADEVMGPTSDARADADGQFTIVNVPAGMHQVRVNAVRGYTVKSITLAGQDVTDTPLQVRGGETLSGMRVLMTNQITELNGSVLDSRGAPASDYTVLAFAEDPARWRPQSRHIVTVRPDQTGRYQLRGLPPGSYLVTTIDPVEQGQWYDPAFLEAQRSRSERTSIGEGETRTLDLTVNLQ
jgi:hypothetical protein